MALLLLAALGGERVAAADQSRLADPHAAPLYIMPSPLADHGGWNLSLNFHTRPWAPPLDDSWLGESASDAERARYDRSGFANGPYSLEEPSRYAMIMAGRSFAVPWLGEKWSARLSNGYGYNFARGGDIYHEYAIVGAVGYKLDRATQNALRLEFAIRSRWVRFEDRHVDMSMTYSAGVRESF